MVTQRAGEALNDQRETARRALHHQQGELLAATHLCEAAARQNLVNALARNDEAHTYNVQMQTRQPEHEADARFSRRHKELLSRFSQEANQALENQRDIFVKEPTSEVRRRDEQVYDSRTKLSIQTLHSKRHNATTKSRLRWTTPELDRIGSRDSSIERSLKNLALLSQLLDQKLIDFDEEKKNDYEKYDVTKMTEQNLRLNFRRIGQTWSPTNPGHRKATKSFAIFAAKLCN